ncbi:GTPase-GDP dissociation stimulator vimar isoform X2 [Nymphalis io]|uniref:GTPase-GDP dissociation stimulator vimar isoform X2 n=1 Tax=Inachis io TaxID=171585 RepID=UPI0021685C67|nr:GTPase-GDP dissociation stimulator vimar isoform X2 [Nymphalis io]
MDGSSAKKSSSFEKLVIQNIENVSDLKTKLNEIISEGSNYEYDVSSCLKALLKSSDQVIVLLTVQAISELAKCENKRQTYAVKDVIEPILLILNKEVTLERIDLIKQCCRALGNLCCDCDTTRILLIENNGIEILYKIMETSITDTNMPLNEIKLLTCKTLLNFAIGGQEYSESLVKGGLIECIKQILSMEYKKEQMEDDVVSTVLLILSVINDNDPEFLYDANVNTAVLNILKETTNIEVSELCLEHLHTQAEHDTVKTLLANEGGVNLVCLRLEQLMQRLNSDELTADDNEVVTVMKQACDLIIIVLTGDEAMNTLYNNGKGEVYLTMVRWLDSKNYQLLTTAVLAIGNFARRDDYCTQMMDNKIFDKLLDIFELFHGYSVRSQAEGAAGAEGAVGAEGAERRGEVDASTACRLQHAALSAMRNLSVAPRNKQVAARTRAAAVLVAALPVVRDHHVAYKLLAAIRMLVDGQENVARVLAGSAGALRAAARWGADAHAGAGGEAPRLLAWLVRLLPRDYALENVIQKAVSQVW